MDTMRLMMDAAIFSPDVIARTAQRYTADYFVEVNALADGIEVHLTTRREAVDTEHLAQRFRNDALDDRLRAAVAAQTAELQTVLVQAALSEAQPRSRSA